jgi:glycosyltransferase involved in cell wall biosynthesis
VESVLTQTHKDIEYIVVDGASTDNTLSVLQRYSNKIDSLISEPDDGIYDAINKGIDLATGDVIGILNSDDFFESTGSIQEIVNAFELNPTADIIFGDVVITDSIDTSVTKRYYSSQKFKPWKLRFGWMPPHPATFARKSAYEKCGQYRLSYQISADYEMFVRWLLVANLSYNRIDRVLVRMRKGGLSSSGIKSSILLNREIVRACVSNGVYTNFLFLLAKIPFKLLELVRKPKPIRP